MKKALKIFLYLSLTVVVMFLVHLAYRYYKLEKKFDERITITITRSVEECDEFKVLWRLLNVDNPKFEYLINDNLYLLNDFGSQIEESDTIVVSGYLYVERRSDDYLGCRESLLFQNEGTLNK